MERDWHAVAEAINTRLAELAMTQQELSTRSGVSVATLRQMQRGLARRRSPRTLADVSEALRWPSSQLAAIADGGVAARLSDGPASGQRESSDALAALQRTVDGLADRLDAIERRLSEK